MATQAEKARRNARMREHYRRGFSVATIAEVFGLSQRQTRKIVSAALDRPRPPGRPRLPLCVDQRRSYERQKKLHGAPVARSMFNIPERY